MSKEEDKVSPKHQVMINNMKESLINNILQEYHKFVKLLDKAPLQQHIRNVCVQYLDTGMLWLKEGITCFPLKLEEKKPETQAATTDELPVENQELSEKPVDDKEK